MTISIPATIKFKISLGTRNDFEKRALFCSLLLDNLMHYNFGDFDKWNHISQQKLHALLGQEITGIIDFLYNKGIIDIDKHYNAGFDNPNTYTKSYKFMPEYHGWEIEEIEIILKSNLKNLQKYEMLMLKKEKDMIDKDPYLKMADEQVSHFSIHSDVSDYLRQQVLDKTITSGALGYIQKRIDIINQGQGQLSRDSSGRIYTAIQRLPRDIRHQFLLIDGKPCSEIDIHGAHLSFLCNMLKPMSQDPYLLKEIKLLESWLTDPIKDVYQEMIAFGEVSLTRDQFKTDFNAWINSHPDRCRKGISEYMVKYFPKIEEITHNIRKERDGLGQQLRRIESDLMIDSMFEIYRDNGVIFSPIHDGVSIVSNQGPMVKAMVETMLKFKDIKAKVKIK